jgi:ferredoxin-NADP reductase
VLEVGDQIELRGPVGGWFVWRETQSRPVLLIGGGSGVVPLMAMVRARGLSRAKQPFRLIYSVRTPDDVIYREELPRHVRDDPGFDLLVNYTRKAPEGSRNPPKRIDVATINSHGWPPDFTPDVYVCGPTTFVETAADILVALGHDPKRIRTERFGGTS